VKVTITGADGFIGRHLVRTLLRSEHRVLAACRLATEVPSEWARPMAEERLRMVPFELDSAELMRTALEEEPEAIVHLAGVAYSQDAKVGPDHTWRINAGGTAGLLAAVARARDTGAVDPLVIVVSTAEVYGHGEPRPRLETEAARPQSVYSASKLGAEAAAALAVSGWGLRVIVTRPFPATGPGQANRLLPNWLAALRAGRREVEGNPSIVRDYMDVRDAAAGYAALLTRGRPGETYNLATGRELRFGELFTTLTRALGVEAKLVPPAHPRREPVYLVGNPTKLRQDTGWQPTIQIEQTLADMIDAQTH
jgi:GDP-4-dehydro-6-deoxy-D-mannose reductase